MIQATIRPAKRRGKILLATGLLAFASACATTNGDSRDPFEGLNRSIYGFNQVIDEAVLKPVSTVYRKSLPEIVQSGVRNFLSNIEDIFISINNLLQGKVVVAANDGMRFALNTTIGGFGLLDWATEFGLEKHNEDFGQTLGRWGVGDGPYIVWPILGASTARDSVGNLIGIRVDPVRNHEPVKARNVMHLTRAVSRRADLLDASRILEEAALDKYVFERDAYLQRRRNLIHDGNPPRGSARGTPVAEPVSATERASGADADHREGARGSVRPAASYEPRLPDNYAAVLAASVPGEPGHAQGN